MTVSASSARADYTGNGVTTAFAVPFYFLDNTHLLVIKTVSGVATTLVLNSDYTVTGAGSLSGGTVTCIVAPASGAKLSILRDVAIDQQTHYVPNDPFPASSHETAIDKLTMICQQLDEAFGRTLYLPANTTGVSTSLPTPSANQLVGWNSGATGLTNIDPNSLLTIAGSSGFSYQTFSGTGAQTAFTLTTQPGAIANLDVFLHGVRQTPVTDYTLSGNTLTFTTAPVSGTNNILAKWGQTLGIGVPSDTSVTTAKLDTAGVALPNGSTATTQSSSDSSTKVATTAMVQSAVTAGVAAVPSSPTVRQTVLSGPVDSSGFAAFGGSTGSTTVTASGTLKATAAAGGDANYTGSITNPSWTGLSTNGTMYLYLDITSGGVVTTGSATLAPTYQWGGTSSTTNNQYTFNIQEMTMKVGNGSTASQVYRVFVGEVTVSGGVTASITWYALMGRYDSGLVATLPGANTAVSANHNIGVKPSIANTYFECITTDNGYAVGDRVWGVTLLNGSYGEVMNTTASYKTVGFATNSNGFRIEPKAGGAGVTPTAANWKYGFSVNRGW